MKTDSCQRYLEDPEANASHLDTCAECRAFFAELEAPITGQPPLRIGELPLAPWEGASHRPWPLIIGGALAVLAMAIAVFAVSGASPMIVLRRLVPSMDLVASVVRLGSEAVQHAPAGLQIALVVSFIVVNTVFFLLLRRAPKGIDV